MSTPALDLVMQCSSQLQLTQWLGFNFSVSIQQACGTSFTPSARMALTLVSKLGFSFFAQSLMQLGARDSRLFCELCHANGVPAIPPQLVTVMARSWKGSPDRAARYSAAAGALAYAVSSSGAHTQCSTRAGNQGENEKFAPLPQRSIRPHTRFERE
jgi:hypothetical protein